MLNILAISLIILMVLKLIFWLVSGIPISRGSLLIIVAFVVFLFVKTRYTYFFLGSLVLFCLTYKFIYHNWSGYLAVDFMSSIRNPKESTSAIFLYAPYVFYFLVLLLLTLPSTRKVYFSPSNPKSPHK